MLRRVVSGALVLAVTIALLVPAAPGSANEDPSAAIGPAMERLTIAVDAIVAAEAVTNEARARRDDAAAVEVEAQRRSRTADGVEVRERDLYGRLGAASYLRHGVADQRDHQVMISALSARRTILADAADDADDARDTLRIATAARTEADRILATTETVRTDAEADRAEAERLADEALAGVGAVDLPAIAYLGYQRAAADVNRADPECRLPAAVLAGYGRLHWRHGRPTGPTAALAPVAPQPGDPLGPYDLQRAATPIGAALCGDVAPLDTFATLMAAVAGIETDGARADVVLAAARRYAAIPGVDLGIVPPDPSAASSGVPQFDDGGPVLAPGDVTGMLDWAMSRIGTPYSQCLGPEVRPQDPICPPGTNRFGAGFFDCSGFVLSAYRRIGVRVPATTYAMEDDAAFMATQVADRLDPALVVPGDIFLMNGHTGLYVGGGWILHARGGGLTLEPTPSWVAHATFAVLRPVPLPGSPPA